MEEEIREQVAALVHAGKPEKEIVKVLRVSRSTVTRVKKRLKEQGHVKRLATTRKKFPVINTSLINKVKRRINRNPHLSMRSMASELSVSDHTIRRIVKDKLGGKSRARTQRFLLTARLKDLRLLRAKKILWQIKKKMPVILFSDEKYFTVDPIQNSRTDRYISTLRVEDVPDNIKTKFKTKHPSQVMVFGLVASNGLKMDPVFLPSGFRMGAVDYLEKILKPHVFNWIQTNFMEDQNYVFMQDGAPGHTAKIVQAWLQTNLIFWPKDVWPPSSPDLNPLDYSIWAFVQSRACKNSHPNLEALKSSIVSAWESMSEAYIRKTCSRFRPRIEAVIKAEGGHI